MVRPLLDAPGMYDVLIDPCPSASSRARLGSPHREDVALRIARRVASLLGSRSALTRASERSIAPAARAAMARKFGARVFLSLHARAGGGRKRPHATCAAWVHHGADRTSRALAIALQSSMTLGRFGAPDGRVGDADVAVLTPDWLGGTPACLLDMDVDDDRFNDDGHGRDEEWIDAIARTIARAVKDFLRANVDPRARTGRQRDDDERCGDDYGRMGRRWVYGDGEGDGAGMRDGLSSSAPATDDAASGDDVGIDGPIPDAPDGAAQALARHARSLDAPQPECEPASRFVPAHPKNYRHPSAARTIDQIVVHITDGGANINGTISWFQNPASGVSAHYVVGQDGTVVQMVRHEDIAYHAHSANRHSIGIEHVARAPKGSKPALNPTPAQYCASAMLVRCLCNRYGIPMDRTHILGHSEADPATTHADCPNAVWDWAYYMGIVTSGTCPTPASGPADTSGYGLDATPVESGSDFLVRTAGMSAAAREAAIVDAILAGNTPAFMDAWHDVPVSGRTSSGAQRSGTIRVKPDYLCIGTDADFVRIPMNPLSAQRLADQGGCLLPTRKLALDIYHAPDGIPLAADPLPPGGQMTSNEWYRRSNDAIEGRRAGQALGSLFVGHKKDVLTSTSLDAHPHQVIIFGFFKADGTPWQPLSWIHENTYVDYSHGIRLIHGQMLLDDGSTRAVADVLADPDLCGLVSDEGALANPRAVRP